MYFEGICAVYHTSSVPKNHDLIILSEHTLETEHLGPREVLGRAVAGGISCGCGGTLGAVCQMVLLGVLFDHQMSRKDHQSSTCCSASSSLLMIDQQCFLVACCLPRWWLSSHAFHSRVCTALAKRMYMLNQTPLPAPFHLPANPLKIPLYQTC